MGTPRTRTQNATPTRSITSRWDGCTATSSTARAQRDATSRTSSSSPSRACNGRGRMEREVMITGVGGQGVQLAAQVLARAATIEGRNATFFGVYSGHMRGGNSDSPVVVADGPLEAPPIISRTWSAVVLHHEFWEPL